MVKMVDVVIVGGGVLGLSCARFLRSRGRSVVVLEREGAIGGQFRTQSVDGALCDASLQPFDGRRDRRGPLRKTLLDFLEPGVVTVDDGGEQVSIAPHQFMDIFGLISSPDYPLDLSDIRQGFPGHSVGVAGEQHLDRVRRQAAEGILRCVVGGPLAEVSSNWAHTAALNWLSSTAIARFGAGSVPARLAEGVPVRLGCRVTGIDMADGPTCLTDIGPVKGRAVVVASGPVSAARILGLQPPPANSLVTHWFRTAKPPTTSRSIHLWTDPSGSATQSFVVSNVSPAYCPDGALMGATTVVADDLRVPSEVVRHRLGLLYQTSTDDWQEIANVTLNGALPLIRPQASRARESLPVGITVAEPWGVGLGGAIRGGEVTGRRVNKYGLGRRRW